MSRFLLIYILLFAVTFTSHSQVTLSEQSKISLLTSTPYDDEVFTPYGHTSIRVVDAEHALDLLFNYGYFNLEKPHFIYRFVKGETDYLLRAYDTRYYITDAVMTGFGITEQVLNLNQEEKQAFWEALVLNAQPENAEYRYNFFYDNCSTRPADLIERFAGGEVIYDFPEMHLSFRDLINYCTRNKPWQTLGCDLVLGAPTDDEITPRETFFLPEYLKNALETAKTITSDGTDRPVVAETHILIEETREEEGPGIFTPMTFLLLFLILYVVITYLELNKNRYYRWFDVTIFFVLGVGGCIVYFISFVSIHPATYPNWNVLWMHPFHLIGALLIAVKGLNRLAIWYHFINFATFLIFLIATFFITQYVNVAVLGFVLLIFSRTIDNISRWKKERKKSHSLDEIMNK